MPRILCSWLLVVLFACSCAAAPVSAPGSSGGSQQLSGAKLPALPPTGAAVKRVSDTAYYDLQPEDVVDSQGVEHWDMGFDFSDEDDSYAIFGLDPGEKIPARLDVDAYCLDLWIAVADYDKGCWRFLGRDGLHTCGMVELSDGVTLPQGMLSGDGKFYLLLFSPKGYSVGEALLRLYLRDGAGDNEPPQWSGAPGVKSVEFDEYGANIAWDAADDPSGVAYYAVFVAPAECGINYSAPCVYELGDATSSYVMFPDEGYTFIVDIQAIDSLGNATPVNTPFEFSFPDTPEADMLLAEVFPGDKVVLTWDDPAVDCGFYLAAPNMDEADPAMFGEFNGRSFITSQDSLVSGVAEEWVQLRANPPGGVYEFDLVAHDLSGATQSVHAAILTPDGTLRRDLGDYVFTQAGSTIAMYARLYVKP
jgi:hypothetical protein